MYPTKVYAAASNTTTSFVSDANRLLIFRHWTICCRRGARCTWCPEACNPVVDDDVFSTTGFGHVFCYELLLLRAHRLISLLQVIVLASFASILLSIYSFFLLQTFTWTAASYVCGCHCFQMFAHSQTYYLSFHTHDKFSRSSH